MKKKLNLQLFADETNEGAVVDEQEKNNNETKEPETEQQPPSKDEKKYTDDDVNKIINKKFAEWAKKQEDKVNEAAKLAEMNAQEKAEYERDELQKKYDELVKKDALSEMAKAARAMLSSEGINASDELVSMLITTDAEQTKTTVNAFVSLFKKAVESGVKELARGKTPPNIENNNNTLSELEKRIKKYE